MRCPPLLLSVAPLSGRRRFEVRVSARTRRDVCHLPSFTMRSKPNAKANFSHRFSFLRPACAVPLRVPPLESALSPSPFAPTSTSTSGIYYALPFPHSSAPRACPVTPTATTTTPSNRVKMTSTTGASAAAYGAPSSLRISSTTPVAAGTAPPCNRIHRHPRLRVREARTAGRCCDRAECEWHRFWVEGGANIAGMYVQRARCTSVGVRGRENGRARRGDRPPRPLLPARPRHASPRSLPTSPRAPSARARLPHRPPVLSRLHRHPPHPQHAHPLDKNALRAFDRGRRRLLVPTCPPHPASRPRPYPPTCPNHTHPLIQSTNAHTRTPSTRSDTNLCVEVTTAHGIDTDPFCAAASPTSVTKSAAEDGYTTPTSTSSNTSAPNFVNRHTSSAPTEHSSSTSTINQAYAPTHLLALQTLVAFSLFLLHVYYIHIHIVHHSFKKQDEILYQSR
ncbi:hypothetical protein B0H16DRAFT_135621 [Mycena metata]|uniref:Uncharacterized protein n=1 Tax=Mycena metata TaxID=1033252 RepID=A0AAD7I5Y3_9AGAR|nr:hypothetical protein B0H16DRAFT_135621 [Mycena metata]